MLVGSLSTALVPELSSAVVENKTQHIENRIKSSITFTLIVSSFFVPLFLGVGDIIGEFLYNNALSGTLLQIFSWVMIPMGLTNITSAILNSMGLEIRSCINYFFGAIALFLCIWFLPSVIGINAFAVGMGVSTIISSFFNVIMIKRKAKIKLNLLKPLITLLLIILPCAAITSFLGSLLRNIMPDFFVLMFSCVIGGIFFILLSIIFGVMDINYLTIFKNKFKILKREKTKQKNV